MSKRNRYKFRNRDHRPAGNAPEASAHADSSPMRSMSGSPSAQAQHAAEYKIISKDLIRLVVLNGLMLAAVLVLYFANKSSGIVEKLYSQIF